MPSSGTTVNAKEIDALFVNHSVKQVIDIQERTKDEIREKQQELRKLVGTRYRDLIDASDSVVAMQKLMQQFDQRMNNLTAILDGVELLEEKILESGSTHDQHAGHGTSDEASTRQSLLRVAETCDLLQSKLTHLPDHARLFNECWSSVNAVSLEKYSMWQRHLLDRLTIIKSRLIQQLEAIIERPIVTKEDCHRAVASLSELKHTSDRLEQLRRFLSIRKRSLQTCPAESFLLTIFLAALLFHKDISEKLGHEHVEFVNEIINWITEVQESVVQGILESLTDRSQLIQEEERIQSVFAHFDQFISKEDIVSSIPQFKWRDQWDQVCNSLKEGHWDLYTRFLKQEFHKLRLNVIRDTVLQVKQSDSNFINRWTCAREQCLALLDDQAGKDLFVQLWHEDLREYIEIGIAERGLEKAHEHQCVKRFVPAFALHFMTSLDSTTQEILDQLEELYLACFDQWISETSKKFVSIIEASVQSRRDMRDLRVCWKSATIDGEEVLLPSNPDPAAASAMRFINLELLKVGGHLIEYPVVERLGRHTLAAALHCIASMTGVDDTTSQETHALQILFDTFFLGASLADLQFEKLEHSHQQKADGSLESTFVSTARSMMDRIDPINLEIFYDQFCSNLKACLARHALFPIQAWLQQPRDVTDASVGIYGSSAVSGNRFKLTEKDRREPNSSFFACVDQSKPLPPFKLLPVGYAKTLSGVRASDSIVGGIDALSEQLLDRGGASQGTSSAEDLFSMFRKYQTAPAVASGVSSGISTPVYTRQQQQRGVLGSLWSSLKANYSASSDDLTRVHQQSQDQKQPPQPQQRQQSQRGQLRRSSGSFFDLF